MNTISHALIGCAIGELSREKRRHILFWSSIFAFLPDLTCGLILTPFIGYLKGRPWLLPFNSDWYGFRSLYPKLCYFYDIQHGLIFLAFVIVPIVLYFKLPKICIWSYLSHILIDIPTHYGEWGIKVFWPFQYKVHGWWNSWDFTYFSLTFCIACCLTIWMMTRYTVMRIRAKEVKVKQASSVKSTYSK